MFHNEHKWFSSGDIVAFMATKEDDPLLCLTVSTTLRPKPLTMTPAREPLALLLEAAGGLSTTVDPTTPTNVNGEDDEDESIDVIGLDEVNLLENLSLGPSFAGSLNLPSLRLGPTVRKNVFSLPPVSVPDTPQSAATTITRSAHPTLRKSFRKTLQTVSGFRVRMRTVFVPYFMPSQDEIPSKAKSSKHVTKKIFAEERNVGEGESDSDSDSDDPDVIHARELREAGNEEHTVILCVEVENTGESMSYFSVESINVNVGGEGATTRLITWGDPAAPPSRTKSSEKMFPLYLGPREQYNMLYAVSFLKNPEADEFSLARGKGLPGRPVVQELQRAVAIIINGRPFDIKHQAAHPSYSSSHLQPISYKRRSGGTSAESLPPLHGLTNNPDDFIYPTHTFPSRWNCVLDLSAQPNNRSTTSGPIGTGSMEGPDAETMINDALPTPASPFPPSVLRSSFPSARTTSPRPISVQSTMGAVGMVGSPGGRSSGARSGTPTPQGGGGPASVAGSKKHSLSAMDAAERSSSAASTPRGLMSPVNYKSKTSMLNPANQRDPHMQSGSQLQIQQQQSQSQFQSFAALAGGGSSGSSSLSPSAASNPAASGSSSLNPILGSLNTGMGQFQRTSNAYIPPSVTFSQYAKSPTTYGPISPPLPPVPSNQSGFNVGMPSNRGGGHHGLGHAYDDSISSEISVDGSTNTFTIFPSGAAGIGSGLGLGGEGNPPPTPAYPAYPSSPAFPPTPNWQGPINYSSQSGSGPSVEIKRDKASSGSSMGIIGGGLGTPGPRISTGGPFASLPPFGGASVSLGGVSGMGKGEPIVVSVGLLPLIRRSKVDACRSSEGGASVSASTSVGEKDGKGVRGDVDGDERIYPLDQFTLDIFVFNQSSWTRRFEVSYPDRRKLRKGKALLSSLLPHPRSQGSRPTSFVTGGASKSGDDDLSAGVLPLENRVRIGYVIFWFEDFIRYLKVDYLVDLYCHRHVNQSEWISSHSNQASTQSIP